jgi:hypothetical protein
MRDVMAKFTQRERLISALLLEEPDIVPTSIRIKNVNYPWMAEVGILNYVMNDSDVIWRIGSGANAFFTKSANIHVKVDAGSNTYIYRVDTPKGCLTSVKRNTIKGKPYVGFWTVKAFLETDEDIERFLSIPYSPCIPNLEPYFERVNILKDRGIVVIEISDPVGAVGGLFPLRHFIKYCLVRRDLVKELLDTMFERICDYLERMLVMSEEAMIVELSGSELVAPPFLHPRVFEELVVKYDRKLIELIHEYGGLALMHCHGKASKILETIASIGIDGLHPLEPPPSGDVDLEDAKKRVGDRFCIIGNIQLDTLCRCSGEKLDEECKNAIMKAAPGGGFILEPTATPLPDTPVENIKVFIKAGRRYGSYMP